MIKVNTLLLGPLANIQPGFISSDEEQETCLNHALMLLASALVNIVLYMFSKSTG